MGQYEESAGVLPVTIRVGENCLLDRLDGWVVCRYRMSGFYSTVHYPMVLVWWVQFYGGHGYE